MEFQNQLNEIARSDKQLQARSTTFLSDISSEDLGTLRLMWPGIDKERRRTITRTLRDLAEDNIELDFTRFFQLSAEDSDPRVREAAIEGLWEDESITTLRLLLERLNQDDDAQVKTAAALSLSRFAYLAELGKLRGDWPQELRAGLLGAINSPTATPDLRRRAIEALSYLSGDTQVIDLIANAYTGGGKMKASALLSMGRNMDERWEPILLHELNATDAEIRYEAARAVGEQGRRENAVKLLPLLDDSDNEVKLAAIWALGQLGGKVAEQSLVQLRAEADPAVADAAEAALEELRYSDNPLMP